MIGWLVLWFVFSAFVWVMASGVFDRIDGANEDTSRENGLGALGTDRRG